MQPSPTDTPSGDAPQVPRLSRSARRKRRKRRAKGQQYAASGQTPQANASVQQPNRDQLLGILHGFGFTEDKLRDLLAPASTHAQGVARTEADDEAEEEEEGEEATPKKRVLTEHPTDGFRVARLYVWAKRNQGRPAVCSYRGKIYVWTEGRYVEVEDCDVDAELCAIIKNQLDANRDARGNVQRYSVSMLSAAKSALRTITHVSATQEMGSWLGDPRPGVCFPFPNGVLIANDLGQPAYHFHPPTPDWFDSTLFPYDYDRDASCLKWLAFLQQIFASDMEVIDCIQEFIGYLLVKSTAYQKALLLEGMGANGKSVLLAIITALLGEDNVSNVDFDQLGTRFGPTPMINKHANIVSEIGEHDRVAEGILKAQISGDRRTVDRKNLSAIQDRPTARWVIATNNRPPFSDRSDGIWRRLIYIPMRVQISAHQQDPYLVGKLKAELPGIFNWALEGLRRLTVRGRFNLPRVSQDALTEYRADSNPTRTFLTEHLIEATGPQAWVETAAVYTLYKAWAEAAGFKLLDDGQFGRELKRVFPKAEKKRRSIVARGQVHGYEGVTQILPMPTS